MSRNIKTVKCLEKHVGKTVKVVDEKGHTFLATVKAGNKGPCLWTTDKTADDSISWWGPIDGEWGHHCVEDYQITDELKSLTLVSVTPKEEKKKKQEEAWTSSVWPQDYINKVFKTSEGKYIAFLKSDSKDGAGPAVCCFPDGSRGWRMYKGEKDTVTTGVPKEFFKVFKSAFFVSTHDEYGTPEEYICSVKDTDKLQKIYEELNTEEEKKDFLSHEDIKKYTGHFCRLADGQKAFIAARKNCDTPVIILSDRFGDDKRGWVWHDEDADVIAPKTVLKNARYGWNVGSEYDAETIKVTGILEEAEPDKEAKKTKKSTKKKGCLTRKEIVEAIGKYCKLADGQTAFIAQAIGSHNPMICFSERINGHGWSLGSASDVVERYKTTAKEFKCGWYVTDDYDAAHIKVVEILEDKTAESKKTLSDKTAESKKTVLDLTVRELLEKLNEIVER